MGGLGSFGSALKRTGVAYGRGLRLAVRKVCMSPDDESTRN
jgi:hypothetical protein